jgi:hypothetical protein
MVRFFRAAQLCALLACDRERVVRPAPEPSVVKRPPSLVEVRPGAMSLGDPRGEPRARVDVVSTTPGVLRIELVDRMPDDHEYDLTARDPRVMYVTEIDLDAALSTRVELAFRNQNGNLGYVVAATGAHPFQAFGPVDADRLPSDGLLRANAGALKDSTELVPDRYLPVAWFAWGSPDAGAYPYWVFRLRFRRKS